MFSRESEGGWSKVIRLEGISKTFKVTWRQPGFGQAVLVFAYAIPVSGVDWPWDKILTLCLMVMRGCLIFSCLFLVYASISFFTIEGLQVHRLLKIVGARGSGPEAWYYWDIAITILPKGEFFVPLG